MRYSTLLLLLFAGLVRAQPALLPESAGKLYFEACAPFSEDLVFDCYRSYDEVTQFLEDAADAYPGLVQLSSLGQSYEGRELWVVTITDFLAGDPADKPGIWVDGGIDSDEVVSVEAALGLVHRLLTSDDPEIAELLDTRVFYIAPNVIPDMSERHHRTPMRPYDSTMRPWDDDGDGVADEDGPEDLDGDGEALQMRVIDPAGGWVLHEADARAMRPRKPDDAGPFYARYSEGIDNDGDGAYNEDWPGGIDPNRNYPGNWSVRQRGSGPYPGSEIELRAMLEFIYAHPNIAASQHLHSSGGVILRPPSVPDMTLPASDLALYIALSERGLNVTGYGLATSVYDWNWPPGASNTRKGQLWRGAGGDLRGLTPFGGDNHYNHYGGDPQSEDAYAAYGGSLDGLYELFGAVSFANEIYEFGEDYDGNGRISTVERLRYDDEQMGGVVFKEWTAFDHPTLGEVEIGGWSKFGQNNPLAADLQREVDRNVEFMLMQARATQRLAIIGVTQTDLGDGVYRIELNLRNEGFQPTELAIRKEIGRAVPVRVMLTPADGVTLLSEHSRHDLGHLAGYEETTASWVVRGASGSTVTIEAMHPKAGRVTQTVVLE